MVTMYIYDNVSPKKKKIKCRSISVFDTIPYIYAFHREVNSKLELAKKHSPLPFFISTRKCKNRLIFISCQLNLREIRLNIY